MATKNVTFGPNGPYYIGVAQTTRVDANRNNGVTLVLNIIIPECGPYPVPVEVQMIARIARDTANKLDAAADNSEGVAGGPK